MSPVVQLRPICYRLMIRAVYRGIRRYRTEVIVVKEEEVSFTYENLSEVFKIENPKDWLRGTLEDYNAAGDELEARVRTLASRTVERGFFITVWPARKEIFVRDL